MHPFNSEDLIISRRAEAGQRRAFILLNHRAEGELGKPHSLENKKLSLVQITMVLGSPRPSYALVVLENDSQKCTLYNYRIFFLTGEVCKIKSMSPMQFFLPVITTPTESCHH